VRPCVLALAWSLVATGAPVQAQERLQLAPEQLASLRWRSIGPAVAGGRITDIEVDPVRRATVYVGAASGGVFRSDNHGTTWTPIFDGAANLSVGDIAVAPSDPNVLWVGTGEANNRNSSPWGGGVYRSTDGGTTWTFTGLEETRHIGRILVHPEDPATVWVAALGHLFGPNEERGVYKTTDGGQSWRKVKHVDANTGFVDMVMEPGDPDVLYAAAYQRRRRAFGFVGGGPGSGLYRSTDAGETWNELTNGLPTGDKGRIGLAISARNPALLMAIVQASDGGVFRSTDRGASWTRTDSLNPRPMYYSKIRIDPANDDRIYVLGTQLHRSEDGGRTFDIVRTEEEYGLGVHVDHHALWIDPDDADHLLLGNDGGFYFSFDRGANWWFSGNLPIQQFYDVALDMAQPFNILGGLQDNNAVRGPSAVRRWQGVLNGDWEVIDYGDGMYVQADTTDSGFLYVDSQGGAIQRIHAATGDRKSIQPVPRDTAERYRFDWTSPIVLSRHDASTIYLGGNKLFTSRDRGHTWSETDDLTRGIDRDTLPIMGRLADSTALSRHDGTSSYGEITSIAESPLDPAVIWVGTDDGNVQVTRDGGALWTEVSAHVPGLPHPLFVSRVEASHAAEGRAYVAFDGHWDDDYRPYLYVTDDFGQTWRSLASTLPSATVNVVREHPRNPALLFVGAEDGVFVSIDRGESWTPLSGEWWPPPSSREDTAAGADGSVASRRMPRVPVDDIEIHPRDDALVAATHGRGIWILDDIGALAGFTPEIAAAPAHLFEVQPATLFQHRNSVPTLGQGIFRAPNPPFGAVIGYWIGSAVGDSVTLRVRDERGAPLRTLRGSGAAGLHRVTWDLRLEPLPHDTTDFPPPGLDVGPRGPLVLPGTYTVQLEGASDDLVRSIEVRTDPLMPVSPEEQRRRYDFTVALYALQRDAYFAGVQANRLEKRARTALDSVKTLDEVPATTVARIDSLHGAISSAAAELRRQNGALRGWWRGLIGEFDGGPSTIGTMTGPTEAQDRRHAQLTQRFLSAFEALDDVIATTVPSLNRDLQHAGVPAVQVPRRDSTAATR
jgi:photosystem II stability/assembly factor-like uncharacterized protein